MTLPKSKIYNISLSFAYGEITVAVIEEGG
jgi:hypothetical protein